MCTFLSLDHKLIIYCNNMSNTTGAICGARSAYPSGASEITPCFWLGWCCSVFVFLCCFLCTIICLFVFFIFSNGVVSLFSIYEFDCSSGIFRPSFLMTLNRALDSHIEDNTDYGRIKHCFRRQSQHYHWAVL